MSFTLLKEEIDAILARDPAARSTAEVVLCYPGFHAMIVYRFSHWLWKKDWRLLARFCSHLAKIFTGIEIHPEATIGKRLFIDHATGVVIGQTAEIGDDVTLYQGVTLGGTSLNEGKRHPTLGDGVIVGSGAQVLGPITLGKGARVGANAVALQDVPEHSTVVGIPARVVNKNCGEEFSSYGVDGDMRDPMVRAIGTLNAQLKAMGNRIETLEKELNDKNGLTNEDQKGLRLVANAPSAEAAPPSGDVVEKDDPDTEDASEESRPRDNNDDRSGKAASG